FARVCRALFSPSCQRVVVEARRLIYQQLNRLRSSRHGVRCVRTPCPPPGKKAKEVLVLAGCRAHGPPLKMQKRTVMGRSFENRKNAIFKTAAQKSKLYSKYGKKLYVLAKNGVPDPEGNPALRSLIEKAKQEQVPAHVIDKAIEKARGA